MRWLEVTSQATPTRGAIGSVESNVPFAGIDPRFTSSLAPALIVTLELTCQASWTKMLVRFAERA